MTWVRTDWGFEWLSIGREVGFYGFQVSSMFCSHDLFLIHQRAARRFLSNDFRSSAFWVTLDGDPSTYCWLCWLTFLSLASIQTSVVQSIGSALISAEPAEFCMYISALKPTPGGQEKYVSLCSRVVVVNETP